MQANDLVIVCPITGKPSHFKFREFANRDGVAVVHPALLTGLELLRTDLGELAGEEVCIRITDATRTQDDLEALAERLGWADEPGGLVSRISRHLVRYGGIAADIEAYIKSTDEPVPQSVVTEMAGEHFDYVKGDYDDGHVHVDQRERAG